MRLFVDARFGSVRELRDPARTLVRTLLASTDGRRLTVSGRRLAGSVALQAV